MRDRGSDRVRFGPFEADLHAGELRKNGARVKLQQKPFQALAILLESRGELVTREQLHERLWPENTFVVFDDNLNTAIRKLREALGDPARRPRFVETLPRRGYRFIAPVEHLVRVKSIRSVAVLPFENLSDSEEYFVDGMTEALINDLGRITSLRVVSRTSSMAFKGAKKPLPEIARELGVDALVEGSLWCAGGRVRVTARVIDAGSDRALWAGEVERGLADILELPAQVTLAVVREVQVRPTTSWVPSECCAGPAGIEAAVC